MKAKRKKCTNCAYHEEFKYSTNDTQVQMRCWKHPDVCDHAFVQSMKNAKKYVCVEYTSYDEKAEMDYREAKFDYNMAKRCIAALEKKYPELKDLTTNDERPEYSELIYRCGKKPRWNVGDTLSYHECNVLYEGELDLGKVTSVYFEESLNDWKYRIDDDSVKRFYTEKELMEDKVYKQENITEE